MEIPTARELELEVLLRERDVQLAELTDELSILRQYLSKQPGPSSSEAVTLPAPLLSVLLPHINQAQNTSMGSSTVAAGVTQRMRQLQQENDEMYALLTQTETGKLKDEARSLRRAVAKLEGALKESHKAIVSLSTELDKAHETIMSTSRQAATAKAHSRSPRNSYHPPPPHMDGADTGNGINSPSSKLPPTGPRAHKRPRLSEPQASPPPRAASSLPQKPQTHFHNHGGHNHNHSNAPSRGTADAREHSRQRGDSRSTTKGSQKMDVDEERMRAPSPAHRARDRTRDRERERERNNKDREQRDRSVKGRERDRASGREWDRDSNPNKANASNPRRNGNYSGGGSGRGGAGGGGGGGAGRKGNDRNNAGSSANATSNLNHHENASRTLKERLGPMRPV